MTLAAFASAGCGANRDTSLAVGGAVPLVSMNDRELTSRRGPDARESDPIGMLSNRRFYSRTSSLYAERFGCPSEAKRAVSASVSWSGDKTTTDAPEVDEVSASTVPTWREPEVTLTVDSSFQSSPSAMRALEAALNAWTSVADELPAVKLRVAEQAVDGADAAPNRHDHRIYYAAMGDARANGALAITVATIDENQNAILDADIIVNGIHRFNDIGPDKCDDSCPLTYDLQSVLAHEVGHWFGLAEDYCNTDATMYAYLGPDETIKRDVAQSDIVSAQLAYWQADNPGGEVGCSFVKKPSGSASHAFACLAALALGIRLRRSELARKTRSDKHRTAR